MLEFILQNLLGIQSGFGAGQGFRMNPKLWIVDYKARRLIGEPRPYIGPLGTRIPELWREHPELWSPGDLKKWVEAEKGPFILIRWAYFSHNSA